MSRKTTAGVRGSRTGRPIMALLDLLGRRWALRIVWELRDDQALTSRALRTACDEASPSILQTRLSELRDAGLVELTSDGYRLTEIGIGLEAEAALVAKVLEPGRHRRHGILAAGDRKSVDAANVE